MNKLTNEEKIRKVKNREKKRESIETKMRSPSNAWICGLFHHLPP
jgi:hypothetical protein